MRKTVKLYSQKYGIMINYGDQYSDTEIPRRIVIIEIPQVRDVGCILGLLLQMTRKCFEYRSKSYPVHKTRMRSFGLLLYTHIHPLIYICARSSWAVVVWEFVVLACMCVCIYYIYTYMVIYIYIYNTVYAVLRCNGENMLYRRRTGKREKKNTITKDPPRPLLEISIGARYNLYSADVVCLSRACEVVK